MKRLALLLIVLVSPLGCKKALDTTPGKDENPKVIPGGKGDLSGGAGIQAPRNAAARIANDNELTQLNLAIQTAWAADTNMNVPDANQIMQEIRQYGKVVAMIQQEIVILTNCTNKDGIWAYTKWPQRGGNHYAIIAQGRIEVSPAQLKQALQAQGSQVKLEK